MASKKRQHASNVDANAKKEKKASGRAPKEAKLQSKTKQRSVAAKTVEKWQPHCHATKKFLSGVIETMASYTLAHSNPEIADDVQNHLDMIRRKLYAKIDSTKVPCSSMGDYQKVTQKANVLQESAEQLMQQREALEAAILEKDAEVDELQRLRRSKESIHPLFASENGDTSS